MIATTRTQPARERIAAFFERAPDEALTVTDAAIKFDVPRSTAAKVMSQMADAGQLKRTAFKDEAGKLGYEYYGLEA